VDHWGRITEVGFSDGVKKQYSYSPAGQASKATDGNGNQVHRTYNVFDNPVYEKATDKNGENPVITTYGYDSLGRLIRAVCDGYSYEYDNVGQMIRMTNPAGITVSYEYDLLGRMSRIHNSSDMEVRYEYDCLERLEQITYGNGIVTRYQYDDSGNISQLETKACCLSGMSMMGMRTYATKAKTSSKRTCLAPH